ncbi:MAG: pyruvate dehydrogenase (acetyl-transferring) E1 component subunit alpha [Pseudomonadota bacterium]
MSAQKPTIRFEQKAVTAAAPEAVAESAQAVAKFEIHYHQYLNFRGEATQPLPDFAGNAQQMTGFYKTMVLTRLFDRKAIALQRTGQLGTYASSLGQEAIGVALGTAMRPDDVLLPAYREYAAQFLRGVRMTDILLYWGGDERGMDYRIPREDFPICVPIASQSTHAVGVAYAFKYRQQPRVAVCVLGDGATSKGDFYEAINVAGAWHLPVLFVINNNQWAISAPRHSQSAAETLAQKAIAAGFSGEQVDGNDIIALYERVQQALENIRDTGRPMLIEALTYRICDHTTADDARRYRSDREVETQRAYDPLRRLKQYLLEAGYWDSDRDKALMEICNTDIDAAVKTYLDTPAQGLESMFDYLYENLPDALVEQRTQASRNNSHG